MARYLINDDRTPFNTDELRDIANELDALNDEARSQFRNNNAAAIAHHAASKFLIVSGPGTGKSHLFLSRINYWYQQNAQAKVVVTSFVRKLVADLQNDIEADTQLSDEQKRNITISTLHKFARSIVERNNGTTESPFRPHFRIIAQFWKDIVWQDVLAFFPMLEPEIYNWKRFEEQLHNSQFDPSAEWQGVHRKYFELCRFYNTAGFADLILRARDALAQNPTLCDSTYFIIDEYQDFNSAENSLINQLVHEPQGLLIVGDDEQVLYEELKAGKAQLIRNLYVSGTHVNGMLPFCGRSSFHISKAAEHFIRQHRDGDCIEKIYLPLKTADEFPKVQVIACATASTAVNYIEKLVDDNKAAIDERKRQLADGEKNDPFLLILSRSRELTFYGGAKERVNRILSEYKAEDRYFSNEYYQVLSYYSLANQAQNNFTFRKILYYENTSEERTHEMLDYAIENGVNLCDLEFEEIAVIIHKAIRIKEIIETAVMAIEDKVQKIAEELTIFDQDRLKQDMNRKSINQEQVTTIEHQEEEEAELEEIEVRKMGAIELMTIVGSKGLSADHVIITGFDNVNMRGVTKNAFYVAMTRARKNLHILTALKSGGANEAHAFIDQLTDEHADFSSYKKLIEPLSYWGSIV